jgi:O-antigen ligase
VPISGSETIEISLLLAIATVLFFVVYSMPQIIGATVLLVMIPIQPIDTKYATANVLLTYVIFIAMIMKREQVRLPMLPQFMFFLFICLISMSFVSKALILQNAAYIVSLVSAYMVLCIAYDLVFRFRNLSDVVVVFFIMNIIVAIYCAIQFAAGPNVKIVPFGIAEMTMIPAREDNRLVGPFMATGVTSEFLVIMIFLIVHQFFYVQKAWQKWALVALGTTNLLFLVATGNRGGFLTMIGGAGLFVWMFRKELGVKRVVAMVTSGLILLAMTSAFLINYSEFGELYTRLGETEIEGGIPDTRQKSWPRAIEHISDSPFIGHGPRYMPDGAADGARYPGWEYHQYPHNLYLFMLSTVGMVGFVAFFWFFLTPFVKCWQTLRKSLPSSYDATFAKTGIIIMIVVLIDQIKVEFMRFNLVDYWHFMFALFGVYMAACHRAEAMAAIQLATQRADPVEDKEAAAAA